jgi:hypothetical protein
VTDRQPDPKPQSGSPAASERAEDDVAPSTEPDRRSFLRQLSGEAVWTVGRLSAASSILRRSLVAAGETVIRDLDGSPDARPPAVEAPDPRVPDVEIEARPITLPDPVSTLTPEQHAFIEGAATAALAVNDPSGAPLVTSTMYHWDGTTLRLPGQDFTARARLIDRDGRVALLIEDPATGASVAITGVATLMHGDGVEAETIRILAKYLAPDAATERWEASRASGDRIVIRVRPTRFVWRSA